MTGERVVLTVIGVNGVYTSRAKVSITIFSIRHLNAAGSPVSRVLWPTRKWFHSENGRVLFPTQLPEPAVVDITRRFRFRSGAPIKVRFFFFFFTRRRAPVYPSCFRTTLGARPAEPARAVPSSSTRPPVPRIVTPSSALVRDLHPPGPPIWFIL